jgi:uncharacterized protein YdeI (YjbR/CyaY-like superfamily)
MNVATFSSRQAFRAWLLKHHGTERELIVQCYNEAFKDKGLALDSSLLPQLKANKRACSFFQAQSPWYQRTSSFWVMEAKREETRKRRLAELIARSAEGLPIKLLET